MNPSKETTPDQLLEAFRGRSFKSIIVFTLIVHLVVIGGSSVPYFIESFGAKADSKLSEKERTDQATREATTAIREIATKYGIKPQDLSTNLAGGAPKAAASEETTTPATPETPPATGTQPEGDQPAEEEKPQSAIEKELEVKADGPTVPPIPVEEASEEDLFR
jgi:hypothetical protein